MNKTGYISKGHAVYPESNHQLFMNLIWTRAETLKEKVVARKARK